MFYAMVVFRAFVDPSGGRAGAFALSIGFNDIETRKTKTALLRGWKPLFDPEAFVVEICDILKKYRLEHVMGDRYAGAWVSSAFKNQGIRYDPCKVTKSELYLGMEGYVYTSRLKIPKNDILFKELVNLERRRHVREGIP
jgi:hypothetical protein